MRAGSERGPPAAQYTSSERCTVIESGARQPHCGLAPSDAGRERLSYSYIAYFSLLSPTPPRARLVPPARCLPKNREGGRIRFRRLEGALDSLRSSPASGALAAVLEQNGNAAVAAVVATTAGAPAVPLPSSGAMLLAGSLVPVFPVTALEGMDPVAISRYGNRIRGAFAVTMGVRAWVCTAAGVEKLESRQQPHHHLNATMHKRISYSPTQTTASISTVLLRPRWLLPRTTV